MGFTLLAIHKLFSSYWSPIETCLAGRGICGGVEGASQFVRCFLIKDFRDKGQALCWEQILNTNFPIKWFYKEPNSKLFGALKIRRHTAKLLSTELPLLLIIAIMAHTQKAFPNMCYQPQIVRPQ